MQKSNRARRRRRLVISKDHSAVRGDHIEGSRQVELAAEADCAAGADNHGIGWREAVERRGHGALVASGIGEENLSGDPAQNYFADGMAGDIITGLSRIKWLFVIEDSSAAGRGGSDGALYSVGVI